MEEESGRHDGRRRREAAYGGAPRGRPKDAGASCVPPPHIVPLLALTVVNAQLHTAEGIMREYVLLTRQRAIHGASDSNQTSQAKQVGASSRSTGDTRCAAKDDSGKQNRDAVRSPPPQGASADPLLVLLADRVVGNAPKSGDNLKRFGKHSKSCFLEVD